MKFCSWALPLKDVVSRGTLYTGSKAAKGGGGALAAAQMLHVFL